MLITQSLIRYTTYGYMLEIICSLPLLFTNMVLALACIVKQKIRAYRSSRSVLKSQLNNLLAR